MIGPSNNRFDFNTTYKNIFNVGDIDLSSKYVTLQPCGGFDKIACLGTNHTLPVHTKTIGCAKDALVAMETTTGLPYGSDKYLICRDKECIKIAQ